MLEKFVNKKLLSASTTALSKTVSYSAILFDVHKTHLAKGSYINYLS